MIKPNLFILKGDKVVCQEVMLGLMQRKLIEVFAPIGFLIEPSEPRPFAMYVPDDMELLPYPNHTVWTVCINKQ